MSKPPLLHPWSRAAAALFGGLCGLTLWSSPEPAGACKIECELEWYVLERESVEVLSGPADAATMESLWVESGELRYASNVEVHLEFNDADGEVQWWLNEAAP